MNAKVNNIDLSDITFVKRVNIGSVNPNSPVNEEQQEKQMQFLNRCLNDFPRGRIVGKDIAVGIFQVGEHQITLQRITYHVGFRRKPTWADGNSI
jgi:hypothetical protein